ncbi:MAG: efflux RND transporter periplasmic adaptor subunit [Bacteroidota bacterium]|nr:efflux RND transporter periplasmic adaptor subunit [Bacteroidota bacterium]
MIFRKKVVFGIFLLIFIFILSVYIFTQSEKELETTLDNEEPNITSDIVFDVSTDVAIIGNLVQSVTTSGTTKPFKQVDITPSTSGKVQEYFVEEGSKVAKDELLVKLDDSEILLALKDAESKLIETQIEYNLMRYGASMERMENNSVNSMALETIKKFMEVEEAYKLNRISEKEYQKAKRDYEAAMVYSPDVRDDVIAQKCGLNQAIVNLERIKLNFNYTEIKSPFNGYAADVNINVGQNVRGGEKLLKVVDISKIKVEVGVLETEIKLIKKGSNVEVTIPSYPDKIFKGIIKNISPIIDTQTKTCKVIVELDNREGIIKPGMYVYVKVETAIYKDRLLVPKDAILIRDQRKLVFTVSDGLAKWFYVETGVENEKFVEITNGISASDTVLVNGHYSLAHDAKIKINKIN